MKLIVGLGNPGRQYVGTRHNVGFEVINEAVRRWGTSGGRNKFQGDVFEATVENERVLLLMPYTFMNLSGASVLAARDFHKVAGEDLLIVCDDLNLPTGQLRFRANGSSGGQKGMEDIIRRLGTNEVPRLRIGIDRPAAGRDVSGYVLGKFTAAEQTEIDIAIQKAADGVRDWIKLGLTACMNRYNQAEAKDKPPKPKTERPKRAAKEAAENNTDRAIEELTKDPVDENNPT
jgi:PTH1 family peptidyl-tRNA hydrolase